MVSRNGDAMSGRFSGLVAIVSGGASGIGGAVTSRLLDEGAQVAVLDVDTGGADPRSFSIIADVADESSVETAVNQVVDRLGGVDLLINNAGIGAQGTVLAFDAEEWRRVLDINVGGIARLSRATIPHLRQSRSAVIVNTCSVAAIVGLPERALYSASKGAVLSLTLAMAADHLHEGIRVNCVSPGTTETPWINRLLDRAQDPIAERAALKARQPHGRLVSIDEVADAILSLASPQASSTTGVNMVVDGGLASLRLRPVDTTKGKAIRS